MPSRRTLVADGKRTPRRPSLRLRASLVSPAGRRLSVSGLLLIAAPFVGVACCGLVHIAAANLMRSARTLHLMVGSFFFGASVCAAIAGWAVFAASESWSDRFGYLATALLTYGGIGYCYINF